MKVWITKYALTSGISPLEAEDCGDGVIKTLGNYVSFYHKEGRDWHRTYTEAATKAEEMRLKKIKALQRQIAKFEQMTF